MSGSILGWWSDRRALVKRGVRRSAGGPRGMMSAPALRTTASDHVARRGSEGAATISEAGRSRRDDSIRGWASIR